MPTKEPSLLINSFTNIKNNYYDLINLVFDIIDWE